MTLEALASEIATAAKKEAKAITDAAKAEAKTIVGEAKDEVKSLRGDLIAKAERECAQIETETVASARQANQKSILIARREELDSTKESVQELVASAKLKGRSALLKSLLKEAKGEADEGMALRPVGIDRPALEKAGSGFDIGEDIDGLGGFVLEAADASIVLDYRFDSRLESSWIAALPVVTTELFGE
jgi:V/A-type H+-transporting ATPase subunit E